MPEEKGVFSANNSINRVLVCTCRNHGVYAAGHIVFLAYLSMIFLALSPLPEDISEYFRQQRMVFLNNFSRQRIRLVLFVIMKLAENKILDSETEEFINFWTKRYLDVN